MAETNYPGIDYSLGRSNYDKETGIHYGIIRYGIIRLHEWIYEELEDDYGNPHCPECGNEAVPGDSDITEDDAKEMAEELGLTVEEVHEVGRDDRMSYKVLHHACGDYACDSCRLLFDGEDAFGDEPLSSYIDNDDYKAGADSDNDIWVFKSKFYTRAQYCSPCAPGAGYLANPCESGPKTFCFGPDMFDDDRPCPYPVYRVEDDVCIYTPNVDAEEADEAEEGGGNETKGG